MDAPRVSVIIAVKNGARFLRDALDSVLAQTYTNYEIVVVDGRSTDETVEIAWSYRQARVVVQPRRGTADAYNTGVAAARGAFVAFLSHDDLWTPNKLSRQVDALVRNPALQYAIARVKFFLHEGESIPAGFRRELLEGDHVAHIAETLLARTSLFDRVGRFNPDLPTAEDVDWFARAMDQKIPMAVIPEVLLRKRIHATNLSLSDPDTNNQRLLKVLRESIKRKRSGPSH